MEKPILFSTEMVKAILGGRKSVTRRVIKPQPGGIIEDCYLRPDGKFIWTHLPVGKGCGFGEPFACPYGQPGDTLWVRETWLKNAPSGVSKYFHKADAPDEVIGQAKAFGYRWFPSIHMPREAARIFLTVKSVRVERLQDITPHDAFLEGIRVSRTLSWEQIIPELQETHRDPLFKLLWDSINAKRGYGWDVNPWVWVIEFEREVVTSG